MGSTMKGMWDYSFLTYAPRDEKSKKYIFDILSKAKKVVKGVAQTNKMIENKSKEIKAIVIAIDKYPPEVVAHLPLVCAEKKIPCISVPGETLYHMYRVDDSVAILSLTGEARISYQIILSKYLSHIRRCLY
jgi:hypothetical protein